MACAHKTVLEEEMACFAHTAIGYGLGLSRPTLEFRHAWNRDARMSAYPSHLSRKTVQSVSWWSSGERRGGSGWGKHDGTRGWSPGGGWAGHSVPFGEISLELFQELSSGPPELSSESMSHLSEHFMKKGRIKKHGS